MLPVVSLLVFAHVFVFGGSSNVAQFAGGGGLGLWSVWAHAFPLMLAGNAVGVLLGLVCLLIPPYPSADEPAFMTRVCGLVASGCAFLAVAGLAPDA